MSFLDVDLSRPRSLLSLILVTMTFPTIRVAPSIAASLVAGALLVAPDAARAQDALPWFHTYTVPGNYAVGSVEQASLSLQEGLRTRRIAMSGVPANAEVLAAFLYWETVWAGSDTVLATLRGQVRFRGRPVTAIKSSSKSLSDSLAACRGSGNGQTLTMMRADVLRLLPAQLGQDGEATGRPLVNDADLLANGLERHTVTLPDSGIANVAPQSSGASLVVIYQDPSPFAPLRSIVIHDGVHVQPPNQDTVHTIRGFIDAVNGAPSALTYIGGSGSANTTESVFFGGTLDKRVDGGDPFPAGGALTDRAWSNPTFSIPPGWWVPVNGASGEQLTTTVTHQTPLPYDCLATAAIVFSTLTQDADADGLPDKLETESGLVDPAGLAYPDISGPADPAVRDLFVEIGAMVAAPGTTYGVAKAPYVGTVTDADGHNHMPTPAVLKRVGDALASPPPGRAPVAVHFDVGLLGAYRALGPAYQSPEADAYLLGQHHPNLARGGEQVREGVSARFPMFPGTLSWNSAYQILANAPVGSHGEELTEAQINAGACLGNGPAYPCRRRFDLNRQGIFHYMLYAHARGVPKSMLPCLVAGQPAPADTTGGCSQAANPEYYVPKSVSGVAELPGRYSMVTLGLWDDFVGTMEMQANTTLHELGHNLDLWHGGGKPQFTRSSSGLDVFVQPNCKPNHRSIMSYLFQATGVRDALGVPRPRFSGDVPPTIDEGNLADGPLGLSDDAPFTSWYAPKEPGTVGFTLGLTPATRHCDGTAIGAGDPLAGTVRLDMATPNAAIDWAATADPRSTTADRT